MSADEPWNLTPDPQQDAAFDRLAWAIADHLTSDCNQPCALHATKETP